MTYSKLLEELMNIRPGLAAWAEEQRRLKGLGFIGFLESEVLKHCDIMDLPFAYVSIGEMEAHITESGSRLDEPKFVAFLDHLRNTSPNVNIYIIYDITDPREIAKRPQIAIPLPLN